jgi:hypothetical protein
MLRLCNATVVEAVGLAAQWLGAPARTEGGR